MTDSDERTLRATRRGFLVTTAGLVAVAGSGIGGGAAAAIPADAKGTPDATEPAKHDIEPFWGKHQSGIVTPAQTHTYFASFDLVTTKRDEVIAMFRRWTAAAGRLSAPARRRSHSVTMRSLRLPIPAMFWVCHRRV